MLAQFLTQEPGIGCLKAGSPGHRVAHRKYAKHSGGPLALKGLGIKAATSSPEELYYAIPVLVKPGLGIVAVVEASRDVTGKKEARPYLCQDQQADDDYTGWSDQSFH
jgi:hypothetical protein